MPIALSQKRLQNKHGDKIDSLADNYILFLEKLGIKSILIPNQTQAVDYYFNQFPIAGVILSGGNDVDPELYHGSRRKGLEIVPERDQVEKRMLEIAIKKNLPLLGICRGLQFINVFFKGKLTQINKEANHPPGKNHLIKIVDEKMKNFLGEETEVNSYHNQGIKKKELSPKLKAFALTEDEIIEGVYHPTLPILGIQWHPERPSPNQEFNKKLINGFFSGNLLQEKQS